MSTPGEISQRCSWAVQLLQALRTYEIEMGNIIDPDAAMTTRELSRLEEIVHRDSAEDGVDLEDRVEAIFARVASQLSRDGFSPKDIAEFVNSIVTPGAKLRYCSVDEVAAACQD